MKYNNEKHISNDAYKAQADNGKHAPQDEPDIKQFMADDGKGQDKCINEASEVGDCVLSAPGKQ